MAVMFALVLVSCSRNVQCCILLLETSHLMQLYSLLTQKVILIIHTKIFAWAYAKR